MTVTHPALRACVGAQDTPEVQDGGDSDGGHCTRRSKACVVGRVSAPTACGGTSLLLSPQNR